MRFRFIAPMYGFDARITHIAVPASATKILNEMAVELVGSGDLVAAYVPEGTEDVYQPGLLRGRVVGAVQLVKMPDGKTIEDFTYSDWEGNPRWPIGWPCRAVYAPAPADCPVLRSLVDLLHGANSFQPYVSRFQRGPFRLAQRMAKELETRFAAFEVLP